MNPLIQFTLFLADSNLILSQKNAEWCGHGPILEQDIAITNITLDLLGQARYFYQYAAELMNQAGHTHITEDSLAYLRTEREFKNLLLCEQPNGDWAQTVLRQFFYSVYQQSLYQQILQQSNSQLSAIAEKSLKEITYHIKWSSEWVVRLGDGTPLSHHKMLQAIKALWPYTGEFFTPTDFEKEIIPIDYEKLKMQWIDSVQNVLEEAGLPMPQNIFMHTGGKLGSHTEHLGYILAEMQYLQRTYPNAQW